MKGYYYSSDNINRHSQDDEDLALKLKRLKNIKRQLREDDDRDFTFSEKDYSRKTYEKFASGMPDSKSQHDNVGEKISTTKKRQAVDQSLQKSIPVSVYPDKNNQPKLSNNGSHDVERFAKYFDQVNEKPRQTGLGSKELEINSNDKSEKLREIMPEIQKYDFETVYDLKNQLLDDETTSPHVEADDYQPKTRKQFKQAKKSSVQVTEGKKGSLTVRVSIYVLIFFTMTALCLYIFGGGKNRLIFGYYLYPANSSAMKSTSEGKERGFTDGFGNSYLLGIKPVEPADIKVGDVVSFYVNTEKNFVLTSRVVDIQMISDSQEELLFITCQDNSTVDNPQIPASYIMGEVRFAVPLLGSIITGILNYIWGLIISCILIICLTFAIRNYFALYVYAIPNAGKQKS